MANVNIKNSMKRVHQSSEPFNQYGFIEKPSFQMERPQAGSDQFEFAVRAHAVSMNTWIAEPEWKCNTASIGRSALPSRESKVFNSLSEAVDDACSRGIRQIKDVLGASQDNILWQRRLNSLCAWMVPAIQKVRSQDNTLPLRGCSVIDLACGGLGGFGMALSSLGAKVKLACDIDATALMVYQKNVQPAQIHSDLRTLDGKTRYCDILTLGLMSQAFSRAGNQLGLKDPALASTYRHTLRLLSEIKAKVVVIESVRSLLTVNDGKDLETILKTLVKAGYQVRLQMLNAKGFGLPQNRERLFIVGIHQSAMPAGWTGYFFPQEKAPSAVVQDVMDNHIKANVSGKVIEIFCDEPSVETGRLVEVGRIDGRNAQGYRVYSPMGLGATLTATGGGYGPTSVYAINGNARTLTPREACRMQGLPEWAIHHPTKTHACRHAGNGVAIPVVQELVRPLAEIFTSPVKPTRSIRVVGGAA